MKEYLLDHAQSLSFFKENLTQVNELSKAVLEVLQSKPGVFYAFLPEDIPLEKIHDFNTGGKTSSLRKEVSAKLTSIINGNKKFSCIFDDFNSDLNRVDENDLYQSNGVHYGSEIYYLIHHNSSQELILKCLVYSSTIWHSLCVVFKNDFKLDNKEREIDKSFIREICRNAVFVMIEAYDAESYVCWYEKNHFKTENL